MRLLKSGSSHGIFSPSAHGSGGRCLRTALHKYCVYAGSGPREQLIDLKADPGEMKNFAGDPGAKQVLDRHRKLLRDWLATAPDKPGASLL